MSGVGCWTTANALEPIEYRLGRFRDENTISYFIYKLNGLQSGFVYDEFEWILMRMKCRERQNKTHALKSITESIIFGRIASTEKYNSNNTKSSCNTKKWPDCIVFYIGFSLFIIIINNIDFARCFFNIWKTHWISIRLLCPSKPIILFFHIFKWNCRIGNENEMCCSLCTLKRANSNQYLCVSNVWTYFSISSQIVRHRRVREKKILGFIFIISWVLIKMQRTLSLFLSHCWTVRSY